MVVQVQVLEEETGSKASIGSGFAFGRPGHLVTNFHVISEVLHHPERYRAIALDAAGGQRPLRVLAIDVIHDLAIVETDPPFEGVLEARSARPAKGEDIFALGNPYDLGLSVVEGTYNGLSEYALEEKIHFSGSLNPGMSGGPALDGRGRVVGVNVATAGNQVSFLVPVAAAVRLVKDAGTGDGSTDWHAAIGAQLHAYQERHVAAILETAAPRVPLGAFSVGGKPAPSFSCWGNRQEDESSLYEAVFHQCTTEDTVFISGRLVLSLLAQRHRLVRSEGLGEPAFYALYSEFFEDSYSQLDGSEDDYTPFRCHTDFLTHRGMTSKATFCARRYLRYEGLYDAVFKIATLGQPDTGLETALVLRGISIGNARKLAERHLEAIAWNP